MVIRYILKGSYKLGYVWSRYRLRLFRKIQDKGLDTSGLCKLETEDSLYFECTPVDSSVGYQ